MRWCSRLAALLAACVILVAAEPAPAAAGRVVASSRADISLQMEVESAIGRGLTWLARHQHQGGEWGEGNTTTSTAHVLTAFQGDPSGFYRQRYRQAVDQGYRYLVQQLTADGGVVDATEQESTAAAALMALFVANEPRYEPLLRRGRGFLSERLKGSSPKVPPPQASDLDATAAALEALYYTRYLEGKGAARTDSKGLLELLAGYQNLPGSAAGAGAAGPDDQGGFCPPLPGKEAAGRRGPATGAATWSGLLGYRYLQLDRSDQRVQLALEWCNRNFTLDRNPGAGEQDLFFYYYALARGLASYGIDTVRTGSGKRVNWRRELSLRLMDLQEGDGSWDGATPLSTSFAVLALEITKRGL